MERVLGLNGVYDRSHDTSACLVESSPENGTHILANVEEERFTRSKKAFDQMPHNAINFCLQDSGVGINDVTAITWGWSAEPLTAQEVLPSPQFDLLSKDIQTVPIVHHEAHAASVFYTSPFEHAAVIIVDGQGEFESTTIWDGSKSEGLHKLHSIGIERSLGYLYGAVSKFCGLGSFGAGKVMGLAPYGRPQYVKVLEDVLETLELPEQTGKDSQDAFFQRFIGALKKRGYEPAAVHNDYDEITKKTRENPLLTDLHRDMAASAQSLLEMKMLELATYAKRVTGADYLCLAGGVAMNCVTNSVLQDSGIFKDVFIQPGCEDNGVAMGSALAYLKQGTRLETPYSGPSYDDHELKGLLEALGIRHTSHDDIGKVAAGLIAGGNVLGWFQGGLEFGPRALGNRSILAHPGSKEMRDRVNGIKRREPWRPFGPSVLEERMDAIFMNSHSSPYMLRSFQVAEEWQTALRGIVHVDGSTRPQTVTEQSNPRLHSLLTAFEKMTGLPGVINTSFNDYFEPIVATPLDALRTFSTTGLDALVLGKHLITK